jgi:AcrR family transcriptional regulator
MPRKFNQQQVRKRKDSIIAAALKLASQPGGWVKLTATLIASEACCSYGLVALYLGSMDDLRTVLVRTAIKRGNYAVVAQAMLAGHEVPAGVRAKVIAHIAGE